MIIGRFFDFRPILNNRFGINDEKTPKRDSIVHTPDLLSNEWIVYMTDVKNSLVDKIGFTFWQLQLQFDSYQLDFGNYRGNI